MEYNAVLDVLFSAESSTEPVILSEAKEWCKVELDITEENTLITELIKTARMQCEGYLNISLIARTVTAVLNATQGEIDLPYGPVVSVTSIADETDVAVTEYTLQGVLFKKIKEQFDYLKIIYTAGYTTLPVNFKTAVLQQVVFLYENRGDVNLVGQLSPMTKQGLKPYRRIW